jgi:hypothetical protein
MPTSAYIGGIEIVTYKTIFVISKTVVLIVYNINNQCHVNNCVVKLGPVPK